MRMIHSVVMRENPPFKGPRRQSSLLCGSLLAGEVTLQSVVVNAIFRWHYPDPFFVINHVSCSELENYRLAGYCRTLQRRLLNKNKMISNDQELIQSDPTSCPQNQKGNN